jgi:enhancing lycopene biosynthesis protein 2
MPKVAVVLSGCGVNDGAEIHESVITLLALDRAGAEVIIAAPQIDQAHVVNHLTGAVAAGEKRNVAVESARIARGKVTDLAQVKAVDIDALIFPGGFGAAKNLCTYAADKTKMKIDPQVQRITLEMARLAKPIGAMCIAPVIVAKVLADTGFGCLVTIGNDKATAAHIEEFGATHMDCAVDDIVVDERSRIVTTPAYMLARSIKEAAVGIEKLVKVVLELAASRIES